MIHLYKKVLKLGLLFSFILAARLVGAQGATFTNLYFFSDASSQAGTNADGAYPYSGLSIVSNSFYGVTYGGGQYGYGVLYKLTGTNLAVLHHFNKGIDGGQPQSDLILISNALYGSAGLGGTANGGTIFRYDLVTSNFSIVVPIGAGGFTGASQLIYTNGIFYGTSAHGSLYDYGVIFGAPITGGVINDLFDFGYTDGTYPAPINPAEGVIKSGAIFYGVTEGGGTGYGGTVDSILGTNLTILHAFSNSASPVGQLVLSGNTLFGVTQQGGDFSSGSVFRVNTDSSAFTNLYSFDYSPHGAYPLNSLTLVNGVLYGTASQGGAYSGGGGVVYQINTDGTGYTILYSFPAFGLEGYHPSSDLLVVGNNLYGTTSGGGAGNTGGIFMVTVPAQTQTILNLQKTTGSVVLSWANTNLSLQSTTNLHSSFSTISGATSPYTNKLTNAQMFFRLQGN